jgi:hypothetical protein
MEEPDRQPAGWQPASPVETALLAALERGDQERFCQILAEQVLLVPVVPGGDGAPGGQPAEPLLATMQLADGARVVPVYTSPEGLARPEAEPLTGQHAALPFVTLARRWPDPSWVLAVNPGLPVAAHFLGAELPGLVAVAFAPVNETERRLGAARREGEVLAVLSTAELYLPVHPDEPAGRDLADPRFRWWGGGGPAAADRGPVLVPVFTSPERLRGHLGVEHPQLASRTVDLLALAAAWPDPRWLLAVDPGSPYQVVVAGEQLRPLAERLPRVLAGAVTLQVLVPAELTPSYLEHGYGTVAGVVHLPPDGPVPLAERYAELGLLRPGSPFAAGDESVHLIRWQPDPETAQGWVRDARPRTTTAQLPAGAQLFELRADGSEHLVATYHPDRHGWISSR